MSELPEGWTSTSPLNVATLIRGVSYEKAEASQFPEAGLVPLLRATNISRDGLTFSEVIHVPSSRISEDQYLRRGDVVVAMSSGSASVVGKAGVVANDWHGTYGAFCAVLRPHSLIDARFFGLFFSTTAYRQKMSQLAAGTNINNIKRAYFDEFSLPLPPLAEQKRIVAKVEALLAEVAAARDRLEKVPAILKRFQQSVLAAACSGRLTEDWRSRHDCRAVSYNGEALLEDEGNTDTGSAQLPPTWSWVPVHDLCEQVIDYRGRTPPIADEGTIPHVRTTNVRGGRISWQTESHVTASTYERYMTRGIPRVGDVLFTMEAPLGEVGVVDRTEPFSLAQRILLLRGKAELADGRYLALALASPPVRRAIEHRATGTTVLGIAYKRLRSVLIPVPPLAEQQEILRLAAILQAGTERVEAYAAEAMKRVRAAPQSVLSRAFRGELVATEAELARAEARKYESADELLARVQVQPPTKLLTLRKKSKHRAAS